MERLHGLLQPAQASVSRLEEGMTLKRAWKKRNVLLNKSYALVREGYALCAKGYAAEGDALCVKGNTFLAKSYALWYEACAGKTVAWNGDDCTVDGVVFKG